MQYKPQTIQTNLSIIRFQLDQNLLNKQKQNLAQL